MRSVYTPMYNTLHTNKQQLISGRPQNGNDKEHCLLKCSRPTSLQIWNILLRRRCQRVQINVVSKSRSDTHRTPITWRACGPHWSNIKILQSFISISSKRWSTFTITRTFVQEKVFEYSLEWTYFFFCNLCNLNVKTLGDVYWYYLPPKCIAVTFSEI